jgi:hypothetical protein
MESCEEPSWRTCAVGREILEAASCIAKHWSWRKSSSIRVGYDMTRRELELHYLIGVDTSALTSTLSLFELRVLRILYD